MSPRIRASDVLDICPECGGKAELWEETFYGKKTPRFKVQCPDCKLKTAYCLSTFSAVSAWNKQRFVEKRAREYISDTDGLVELMGQVLSEAMEDYKKLASQEYPNEKELIEIQALENFVMDNPYLLPYDRDYLLEQMFKSAEKARKMQAS